MGMMTTRRRRICRRPFEWIESGDAAEGQAQKLDLRFGDMPAKGPPANNLPDDASPSCDRSFCDIDL